MPYIRKIGMIDRKTLVSHRLSGGVLQRLYLALTKTIHSSTETDQHRTPSDGLKNTGTGYKSIHVQSLSRWKAKRTLTA